MKTLLLYLNIDYYRRGKLEKKPNKTAFWTENCLVNKPIRYFHE